MHRVSRLWSEVECPRLVQQASDSPMFCGGCQRRSDVFECRIFSGDSRCLVQCLDGGGTGHPRQRAVIDSVPAVSRAVGNHILLFHHHLDLTLTLFSIYSVLATPHGNSVRSQGRPAQSTCGWVMRSASTCPFEFRQFTSFYPNFSPTTHPRSLKPRKLLSPWRQWRPSSSLRRRSSPNGLPSSMPSPSSRNPTGRGQSLEDSSRSPSSSWPSS